MKRRELNPVTEQPKNLNDVTKQFMRLYMKEVVTDRKEKDWFKKLVNDNVEEQENKFGTSKTMIKYNLKTIREEFCKKYFPQLIKTNSKSWIDLVNEL